MSLDRLALIPLAVGHLAVFVTIVNVVHGLGFSERIMSRTKVALLALFAAGSILLVWEIAQGSMALVSWPSFLYSIVCVLTGVLFVPLFTTYLHLRPRPAGIEGTQKEVDLAARLGKEALIGPGRHAWLLRLPGNQSFQLRKIDWTLEVTDLPATLDGLSLLHLSDLHLATCFDRRYFEAVFAEAATMPSDLVLFTGDLIDDDRALEWVVPLFRRLEGRVGSFAILGNHDYKHDPLAVQRALGETPFVDLEGSWTNVVHRGTTITLGGTCSPWGPRLRLEERPPGDYSILLSHCPDLFYWAVRERFDLMLSGHNHGGQIRLPLVGSVFMPSLYSRRFDRGFFRRDRLTLHVSQGIAGQHPIRYGCVPELGRLTLRCAIPPSSKRSNELGCSTEMRTRSQGPETVGSFSNLA